MPTLTINRIKLGTHETVRYNGPVDTKTHGTYTIRLHNEDNEVIRDQYIQINLTLEALIQLQQRINAALQHMITH